MITPTTLPETLAHLRKINAPTPPVPHEQPRHSLTEWERLKARGDAECAAYQRGESKQNQPDHGRRVLLLFGAGVLLLIIAAVVAMAISWLPGDQEAVSRAYKARQHVATELAE